MAAWHSAPPAANALGLTDPAAGFFSAAEIGPFLSDPYTGIAAGGFDPVAFFVNREAILGDEDIQVTMLARGDFATFKFQSVANKDAFLASPELYLARFGGHCAMQMARYKKVAGNPKIWAIYDNRLFFFHSAELREQWLKRPGGLAITGRENWASLQRPNN
jgi:hypothetical protein